MKVVEHRWVEVIYYAVVNVDNENPTNDCGEKQICWKNAGQKKSKI